MTSNSPEIYSFCPKPHPWGGDFFLNHKVFVPFGVSSSCLVPRHPTPTPPHTSPISQPLLFLSVPLLPFSCLLSPGLEAKASSHSAKFTVSLPSPEAKGISRPIFPLFPAFGHNGAHLCMGGYGIVHQANASLRLCPPPKRSPHLIHCPLLPPRLSQECLGKLNHALKALAGPACWGKYATYS